MFKTLSPKQAEIFTFPHEGYDALICDGAIRTGKTIMMAVAFLEWSMSTFNNCTFGIAGKTVRSAERNIVMPLQLMPSIAKKYKMSYSRSLNLLTVRKGKAENHFIVYGGKDEASYQLIQGVTLSGMLFDEVALMPRSFVEQGIGRCLSIDDSLLWFNCNPESPTHWFYNEWILKSEKHNAKHLHFFLEDNPGLTAKAIEKAKNSFSGIFYSRYIDGEWVKAEGLVYGLFEKDLHVVPTVDRNYSAYWISNDHGVNHPNVYLLIGLYNGVYYVIREYYYDGRKNPQKTVDEFFSDLVEFAGGKKIEKFFMDCAPIASAFNVHFRRKRPFPYKLADNTVLEGIQTTAKALKGNILKVNDCCHNLIREFGLYSWRMDSETDEVVKENDDAIDCLRYFCQTQRIAIPKRKNRLIDS